ncbi:hypothetical protein GCM10009715_26160 [Paeniglutamicibacter psychrophenolicus]
MWSPDMCPVEGIRGADAGWVVMVFGFHEAVVKRGMWNSAGGDVRGWVWGAGGVA